MCVSSRVLFKGYQKKVKATKSNAKMTTNVGEKIPPTATTDSGQTGKRSLTNPKNLGLVGSILFFG